MGMLDNMEDKAKNDLQDADLQDKAKKMADEHGISMEDAKARLMKQKEQQ